MEKVKKARRRTNSYNPTQNKTNSFIVHAGLEGRWSRGVSTETDSARRWGSGRQTHSATMATTMQCFIWLPWLLISSLQDSTWIPLEAISPHCTQAGLDVSTGLLSFSSIQSSPFYYIIFIICCFVQARSTVSPGLPFITMSQYPDYRDVPSNGEEAMYGQMTSVPFHHMIKMGTPRQSGFLILI